MMAMQHTKKIVLTLCLIPGITLAQSNGINDPSRGGILQKEIEKQLPNLNALPVPQAEKKPITPEKPPQGAVSVLVKGFKFEGVTKVSEAELQEAIAPWLNKTVTLEELNKVAEVIAQYYQSKKLLAQAYLPPQKIGEDGIVLIKVVEAKLGAVKVQEEGASRFGKERVAQYITYKNPVGEYVNTENIEHAIYVLNETPGIAVVTDLSPGEKDGEIALNVKVADTPLVKGSLTVSNFGSASTGPLQGLGNVSINNPLGIGDQLSLNGFKTQGTNYTQAGYSLPIHESGLRFGVTASNMLYTTVGDFSGSQGNANTVGLNLSYPLIRTQATNANLTFNYDTKYYQNALDTSVVNSEYSVDLYTFGFSGNHYDNFYGGGVSTLSLSTSLGHFKNPLWDVTSTSNYGQFTGTQFTKFNLGFTRNQQLVPDQSVLNISISGQLSSQNLDPVERFYLGGPNGIRAYPQSQGSGDQGFMVNLEVQQQLPYQFLGYVFIDAGWVQQYKSDQVYDLMGASNFKAPNMYTLAGFGAGVKYTYENLTLNGFIAFPIGDNPLYRYVNQQYVQQNNDGSSGGPRLWLQGVYHF